MNVISKYYGVSHRDEHGPTSLGLEDIRLHWEEKKNGNRKNIKDLKILVKALQLCTRCFQLPKLIELDQ